MKNLLIGNGLNLTNYEENAFLKPKEIYIRFKENLTTYWDLISKLVDQNQINLEEVKQQLKCNDGIERLSGKIFQYIYEKITLEREFDLNDSYRLIEILGEISIKSIFFKEHKFFIPKISNKYKNKIEDSYDNVFSLNYIEDWDVDGIVTYLHGNLKQYINTCSDIGSSLLSNNTDYSNFKINTYKKIDFKEIIFMPTNDMINKYNYIGEDLYPSDNLYPADDLFPYEGRDIYKALDTLESIEIFGMSPDGDESIIERIKNIKNKKIYVYKLDKQEIEKWKSHGIEDCFVDSSKFLDE